MTSIYPHGDEQVRDEPRRPWSYWADMQAANLRAALGCGRVTFWWIRRKAEKRFGKEA